MRPDPRRIRPPRSRPVQVATWTDEAVGFRCCRSRRTRSRLLARPYAADEVDAFAAYCLGLDTCYFVPLEQVAGRRSL
ncbi:MAG TPA: group I intron-associated PD-(D/E)XK endonuclease [Gaiellaceae bacterium]|nr:group I intron-associated PD-(D/E)XK endonuclease [Gaiellaceae bacterium]